MASPSAGSLPSYGGSSPPLLQTSVQVSESMYLVWGCETAKQAMNMNSYAVSPTNAANTNMMQYNIQPKYATARMYNNFQQVQPVQTVSMRAIPYNSMQVCRLVDL